MISSTPPRADEFEISVIGPGRGECLLLHLGDNEWCIVDSCTAIGHSESVAIDYLDGFGNRALDGVKLVVATHWHDDHIRGLASILRRAPAASFYCSAALEKENFLELVGMTASGVQGRSGIDEFAEILGLIGANAEARTRIATPRFAIENRRLLDLPAAKRSFAASITALSPSDSTLALAHAEIAKLIPKAGELQQRITGITPNHTSVVLWVEAGPLRALLGADLLHKTHPGEGWNAVLASHTGRYVSGFFKVPHHGSANADCPEVWARMLTKNPIAVVTPFNSASLPKDGDLHRLASRTTNLYCTAKGTTKKPSRDPVVEKIMRRQVTERRVIEGRPGHIQVRWSVSNPGEAPTIELSDGAYHFLAA